MANAKTVDMCNNPRYKEPKLNMAQRIASGPLFQESWVELDAEISQAEARWAANKVAANVNVRAVPVASSGAGEGASDQSKEEL